jgi:hypothetical protein
VLAAPVLGLPGATAGGDQLAALHGLYWLAANLAARAPLLLTLDDAHWADVASLRWLSYLHQRLADLPILVALTTDLSDSAASVRRSPVWSRVRPSSSSSWDHSAKLRWPTRWRSARCCAT